MGAGSGFRGRLRPLSSVRLDPACLVKAGGSERACLIEQFRDCSSDGRGKNGGTVTMRSISVMIALLGLAGSAAAQPQTPAGQIVLPYSACGDMATLRANLTGTPYPSPRSDAVLRRLGVRCIGARPPQFRARY